MGEQSHPLIAGHMWSPIMRNSRGKFFMFLAALGTLCFILFFLSNTHSNLKHLEAVHEKCQQQRDSLSAQLQVVYEHKNRLEKSLQQEKSDHKRTKEDYQDSRSKQEMELKVVKDKEILFEKQLAEIKSNYAELESERKHTEDVLKEQIETLQNQKTEELKELQSQIDQLVSEKDVLEQEKASSARTNQQNLGKINLLQIENQQMKEKLEGCDNELKKSKNVDTNAVSPILPIQQNKEIEMKTQENLSVNAAKSLPKENALPRPVVKQNEENNNIEMEKKNVKDADKPVAAIDKNDIKNNSRINAKHQLPLPMIKKPPNALDRLNHENPEDNEIKEMVNVLKPPPYNDNLPFHEGINQPAEKGEYVNPLLPGQVEQPDFKDHKNDEHVAASNLKKFAIPAPNANEQGIMDDAAQVRDMLNKSPGDTNDLREGVLNMPPHDFQANDKMNLNVGLALPKAGAELPDDNPEEDDEDPDGDNEEDMGAGLGQALRAKPFHEHDFEDQEPNDNIGAKEVEGVAVVPK